MASCGEELMNLLKQMLEVAKFTGVFGITFKMDKDMNINFFDINARLDGNLYTYPDFFLRFVVPLAFRMRKHYESIPRIVNARPIHPLKCHHEKAKDGFIVRI